MVIISVANDVFFREAVTNLHFDDFHRHVTTTCNTMFGTALDEVFRWDYGLKRGWSWLLTVVPPLLLFMIGLRTFINVISLAGSLSVGLDFMIFVFVYTAAKSKGNRVPEYSLNIPKWFLYFMIVLFGAGMGYVLLVG